MMDEDEDDRAALRSALQHAVGTICEAQQGRGPPMQPEAVATLCYVVEQYTKCARPRPPPRAARRSTTPRARSARRGPARVHETRAPRHDQRRRRPARRPQQSASRTAPASLKNTPCSNAARSQLQHLTEFADLHELRKPPAPKKRKAKPLDEDDADEEEQELEQEQKPRPPEENDAHEEEEQEYDFDKPWSQQ